MSRYIVKRILLMIPVLIGVIVIVFTIMFFAPGDGAYIVLGPDASLEAVEVYREARGLNDPYAIQLFRYIYNVVFKFDLGKSYRSNVPVIYEILEKFPNTAILAVAGVFFGAVLGVAAGVVSAVKQYSIWDRVCVAVALFGIATPTFWLAMMLVILFSVQTRMLPASGIGSFKHWILPVITLSLYESGFIMRMSRSAMLDIVRQDYIRTARAKGQKETVVILKHVFRNALMPIVTVIGLEICVLLAGAIVVESVFAIPGIGKYCYDAILTRDFPAVQGSLLFISLLCVIVNLIMDLTYGLIDPRIKSIYNSKRGVTLKG